MKIISYILLLVLVGCSTTNYRNPSSVDLSCADITTKFFNNSQVTKLESFKKIFLTIRPKKYQKHLNDESIRKDFKKIVQSISSSEELLETLKMLKSFAVETRQYEFDSRKVTDHYTSVIKDLITTSGLISKTLELKPKIEKRYQIEIMNEIDEIEDQIKKHSVWFSADSVNAVRYHFQMIFDPTSIDDYVRYIIEDVSEGNSPTGLAQFYFRLISEGYSVVMDVFGFDTVKIFSSLPQVLRKTTIKNLETEYVKAKLEVDAGDKVKRRNIEFLLRVLSNDEYVTFFKKFSRLKKISEEDLVSKVDELWLKTRVKFQNPNHYSFSRVLEGAKILQNSSLSKLLKDDESYLIYGSLPNGKANFASSDFDIHPSKSTIKRNQDSFDQWHIESIDPNLEDYINKLKLNDIKNRGMSSLVELEKTEKELALSWGRKDYKKGEVLAIIPSDSDFFDYEKLGIYNSILIEVRRENIFVHFVDMIENKKVITLSVLPR